MDSAIKTAFAFLVMLPQLPQRVQVEELRCPEKPLTAMITLKLGGEEEIY